MNSLLLQSEGRRGGRELPSPPHTNKIQSNNLWTIKVCSLYWIRIKYCTMQLKAYVIIIICRSTPKLNDKWVWLLYWHSVGIINSNRTIIRRNRLSLKYDTFESQMYTQREYVPPPPPPPHPLNTYKNSILFISRLLHHLRPIRVQFWQPFVKGYQIHVLTTPKKHLLQKFANQLGQIVGCTSKIDLQIELFLDGWKANLEEKKSTSNESCRLHDSNNNNFSQYINQNITRTHYKFVWCTDDIIS